MVISATNAAILPAFTPRIFNHDIMGCTADEVIGNHLYSGRALGMTRVGDTIQLHPDLKSEWPFIQKHYRRVGLTYTDQVIWHVDHGGLLEYPDHEISVFFFGAGEHAACPNNDWFFAVDYINSKNNFVALAQSLHVPIPVTRCFASASEIGDREIKNMAFPCYLKAAISVSGVGIYRCHDEAELRQAITRFRPSDPVQVQQEALSNVFLNLQYEADDRGYWKLAATEQILNGPVHQGNRFPTIHDHEPWECVEPMAEWLYNKGIRGIFAFDVAAIEEREGTKYQVIECNPRFNGASYPTMIAHRLGITHWSALLLKTRHRSLRDLNLNGLEYNASRKEGIVIVNWGPILVGRVLFLFAGPPPVQERLAQELDKRL
uniref:ATP-grasp domain-containing protein n=1 Tax=Candidatus Kentrum sp. LPFa TaxID=2126335 RepID=A0A450Y1A3_9GAMM|nr:MAG: ATP-grasp domain-containing protein [Candidatus Kentron sp. LPFa]VFK35222.1 MAG: ATP-grasp domain-containing protein [Candidatus Kentron sp. LPFa]